MIHLSYFIVKQTLWQPYCRRVNKSITPYSLSIEYLYFA
jgi:hypothetical protein